MTQENIIKSTKPKYSEMLKGACSVGYYSSIYWDDYDEGNPQALGGWWKKAIADVGGFISGFVGSLVYNNNSGGFVNPFADGGTIGGLASKLAE